MISRIPDYFSIALSLLLAYLYLSQPNVSVDERAFAGLLVFIGIFIGWRTLKQRGWFAKIFFYPLLTMIFLLLQIPLAELIDTLFSPS